MSNFPHDDERCRQASVDAEGFAEAARQLARLARAIGLPDTGLSFGEIVDVALYDTITLADELEACAEFGSHPRGGHAVEAARHRP